MRGAATQLPRSAGKRQPHNYETSITEWPFGVACPSGLQSDPNVSDQSEPSIRYEKRQRIRADFVTRFPVRCCNLCRARTGDTIRTIRDGTNDLFGRSGRDSTVQPRFARPQPNPWSGRTKGASLRTARANHTLRPHLTKTPRLPCGCRGVRSCIEEKRRLRPCQPMPGTGNALQND